ncbi:tyrosine-type recombinase/integrase [Cerasicoccus frondis]|uniref:tyrosine-type recombinase/integrase n=1 Tax=Cerasicoccus frondis TaxID=490090 RepID=UPI002852D1FA|nr:tyrosine-type recombinase/integrase [Cerasicoccus frondis]
MDDDLEHLPIIKPTAGTALAAPEFFQLAEVPAEMVWLANITSKNTRDAYARDVREFMTFWEIKSPEAFRTVTRAHVIKWRDSLQDYGLAPATIRRKLSALSALCDYLCNENSISHNPVNGVTRPKAKSKATPALSDKDVRAMLDAPDSDTLKGLRDRAILSVGFFHAPRRQEIASLKVGDFYQNKGLMYLRFAAKGEKTLEIPVNAHTVRCIQEYLATAGHGEDLTGPLFRPVRNNVTGELRKGLSGKAIDVDVFKHYAKKTGVIAPSLSPHSMRSTAITNALEHDVDLAKVQEMAGHADISTTRGYDRRKFKPEDSPSYKISY